MADTPPPTSPAHHILYAENRKLKSLLGKAVLLLSSYRWRCAARGDFRQPTGYDYFRLEADRILHPDIKVSGEDPR